MYKKISWKRIHIDFTDLHIFNRITLFSTLNLSTNFLQSLLNLGTHWFELQNLYLTTDDRFQT